MEKDYTVEDLRKELVEESEKPVTLQYDVKTKKHVQMLHYATSWFNSSNKSRW